MPEVKTGLSFAVTALLARPKKRKKGENHKKIKIKLFYLALFLKRKNILLLML